MKTTAYSILGLVAILVTSTLFGSERKGQTARQEYSDSFQISQGAILDLDLNFAEVTLENWDRNEISITGFAEVEARNQEKADKMLKKIKVVMKQSGNVVSFEVNIGDGNNSWNGENINTEIEFTVKAPKWISLEGEVSFGSIDIEDITSKVDIRVEYGSLTAKDLSHTHNVLRTSFGSANVGGFGGGKIENSFGECTIGTLRGNVKLASSYGETSINTSTSSVDEIDIENSFGEITIHLDPSKTYNVDSESSFGDVDISGKWNPRKTEKGWNEEELKGLLGNGSSANGTIEVANSFGSVHLEQ